MLNQGMMDTLKSTSRSVQCPIDLCSPHFTKCLARGVKMESTHQRMVSCLLSVALTGIIYKGIQTHSYMSHVENHVTQNSVFFLGHFNILDFSNSSSLTFKANEKY